MEKQIEEMEMTQIDLLANDINKHCPDLKENYCGGIHCVTCLASALYNAGYSKQSDGEWIKKYDKAPRYVCSVCNHLFNNKEYKFCPNCGAKMKGE